jgi:hypothetical protein
VNTLCFYGYSDDVIVAGASRPNMDEYYQPYFLLSNGVTVEARHGDNGWEFKCSDPEAVIIPAVDLDDEGIDHSDTRIPEWLQPSGYSPVLLIGSEDELSVVCESKERIAGDEQDLLFAARLKSGIVRACSNCEVEDISLDLLIQALRSAGWEGGAK